MRALLGRRRHGARRACLAERGSLDHVEAAGEAVEARFEMAAGGEQPRVRGKQPDDGTGEAVESLLVRWCGNRTI
jgi:hypothetical protein